MTGSDLAVTSLARSALGGAAWNYGAAAVLVMTQIVSTAITARLIQPSQFGAFAAAQAAVGIFGYFTLSAMGQGLLRRTCLGPKTVGTAATLSLLSGLLVAVLMWAVAGPWSNAWGVPGVASLVRVVALTLFFTSCATVPLALLRRAMRFRAAAIIEAGTQITGVAVGILLAVHMHSALALIIGQTVAAGALLGAALYLTKRQVRLSFARSEVGGLFSFASQVSALNLGFFALYTAPSWAIARMFGAPALGLYSRANLIVGLPLNYLATGLTKVIYPLYGRIGEDIARRRALLSEAISVSTGFVWPLFAFIAGSAPILIRVLLGPGWGGSSDLLRLCALIACANLPWVLLTNAAEAYGWMRMVWARQGSYFVVLGGAIVLVYFAQLGAIQLLTGVAAAQWLAYGLTVLAFMRRGHLDARLVIRSHLIHGAVALTTFASTALCGHLFRNAALGVQIGVQAAIAVAVLLGLCLGRFHFPASRVLRKRLIQSGYRDESHLGIAPHR